MEQILKLIGLAKKAGRVEIGEEPVGSAARAKHARVILMADDAAASSVRRAYSFANAGACLCLHIPATKDQLGSALGRTSCAMLAITDIGFADAIVKKLAALRPDRYREASARLELKAQRAMERKKEQEQHEKNLRQGKKRTVSKSDASAKPLQDSPSPRREDSPEKKTVRSGQRTASHNRDRRKTQPQQEARWEGRPVKKGKGSPRKKK